MSEQKALIVLQENRGVVNFLPNDTPEQIKSIISKVMDKSAETFENVMTSIQASHVYNRFHRLTDTNCTRKNLLDRLRQETNTGSVIDVIILGHGDNNTLWLHGDERLKGGENGNIRTLLTDVQQSYPSITELNLRLVYMCNCKGSTLNDDWLAIGADVSIGSRSNNYMPEPMASLFLRHWLDGMSARNAAEASYRETIPFYLPFYPPTISGFNSKMQSSEPVVAGSRNSTINSPLVAQDQTADYRITLYTADEMLAGTNADVYITLFGNRGVTPEIELNNPGDDRERGNVDVYRITTRNIGQLNMVRLRHDNRGPMAGWKVRRMTVRHSQTGQEWRFESIGWLADDEPPFMIDRFLFPNR